MLDVELTTAHELSDAEFERIVAEIEKKSGRKVQATRSVDPDLIGGIVLQAGSMRLDASVRGRLDRLRQELATDEELRSQSVKLRPEEITSILRKRIEEFDVDTNLAEVGAVLQLGDGIARVHGLENCVALEMLELDHGVVGLAFNLEEDNVGVALFGQWDKIKEGDPCAAPARSPRSRSARRCSAASSTRSATRSTARARSTRTSAPARVEGAGRDRAPAGEGAAPDRDQGDRLDDERRPRPARADHRRPLDRQDGDRGRHDPEPARPGREVHLRRDRPEGLDGRRRCYERLREAGAMAYTTIVTAPAHEAAPIKWMAPFAGAAMGEYFLYKGEHALVIYDDLTKQADAYRQLSLLLRRPPGREAFPGDVFYLHSRLLERACKLNDELGGGSLTALPIIETQAGDVSAYIPTNVISITDGQIFLQSDLFFSGVRPAVNVGISVSRVGSSAQTKAMKKVAGPPAPRPRPVPRARGVRAVRLRARPGDPAGAEPRREDGRDAEPAAVRAVADGGAGRRALRRRQRLPRRHPDRRRSPRFQEELRQQLRADGDVLKHDPRDERPRRRDAEKLNAAIERFKGMLQRRGRGPASSSHGLDPGPQAARPLDLEHAQADAGDGARRLGAPAARAAADRGDAARTPTGCSS